jgi:hypothetical protein
MKSYPSEQDLRAALDRSDELVRLCASGRLSFAEFRERYDNLYWVYAMDGHEANAEGMAVLTKYALRIAPHRVVAEDILGKVCSDADADTDAYRQAGRFGPSEAIARLKLVASGLSGGEA